MLFKRRDQPC